MTLRPAENNSPGPRPEKQTRLPYGPGSARPRWTTRIGSIGGIGSVTAATQAEGVERAVPPCADPLPRHRHICLPQRIVAGNPRLYPEVIAGAQQDRAPTAPAPDDGHASFGRPRRVDHLGALRAPEHHRRLLHLAGHRMPVGQRPELLHVEQRMGVTEGIRVRMKPRRHRVPGQEAAARYGSHKGSTSERCRRRHKYPSGGAGFTRKVQPNSERS